MKAHRLKRGALSLLAIAAFASLVGSTSWQSSAQEDDTLRLAGPVTGPETLDPAQARDLGTVNILRQIFRGLVYYDDDLNPVPELAESWQISDDGLIYTFQIRPEATFQDGSPIVAADIVYSLSRAVDPDTTEGDISLLGGPSYLSDIVGFEDVVSGNADVLAGVRAVSESVVEIEIVQPRSTFLMKLASMPATIVDREQIEDDGEWWAKPNGSGPYEVDRWEPGDSLRLERYEDFVLGEPEIENIDYRLGVRALQSFNLYQTDEIDIDTVSLGDIDRVADPDGPYATELIQTNQFGFGYLALSTDIEPLNDPAIRAALQLAFPRVEIADVLFNGWVHQANGVIPDGMLAREWPPVVPDQDLDAARAAIASSTYGDASRVPPIRIYTAGSIAASALADIAETELGLRIEVFELEWYDFLDRLAGGEVPAYELYWGADYPDPESVLLPLFGTDQPDNYLGFSNDEFDLLLDDAAAEQDPNIRAGLYEQANQLLADENVVIPVYIDVQYTVARPWIMNLVVTPIGILRLETVRIES